MTTKDKIKLGAVIEWLCVHGFDEAVQVLMTQGKERPELPPRVDLRVSLTALNSLTNNQASIDSSTWNDIAVILETLPGQETEIDSETLPLWLLARVQGVLFQVRNRKTEANEGISIKNIQKALGELLPDGIASGHSDEIGKLYDNLRLKLSKPIIMISKKEKQQKAFEALESIASEFPVEETIQEINNCIQRIREHLGKSFFDTIFDDVDSPPPNSFTDDQDTNEESQKSTTTKNEEKKKAAVENQVIGLRELEMLFPNPCAGNWGSILRHTDPDICAFETQRKEQIQRKNRPISPPRILEWSDSEEETAQPTTATTSTAANPIRTKRHRNPFSEKEEILLEQCIKKYGIGQWKRIADEGGFVERSAMDLKDKWRNMQKKKRAVESAKIQELALHGPKIPVPEMHSSENESESDEETDSDDDTNNSPPILSQAAPSITTNPKMTESTNHNQKPNSDADNLVVHSDIDDGDEKQHNEPSAQPFTQQT